MGASALTMEKACEERGLDLPCFVTQACFDDKSMLPGKEGCTNAPKKGITKEMCERVPSHCPSSDKLSVRMKCSEDKSGCGALHYGIVFCTDPSNKLFDFAICGEKPGKLFDKNEFHIKIPQS